MPTFNFIVPPSPGSFLASTSSGTVINQSQSPEIYTTTGPLPLENGIVATTNSIAFDPTRIAEGIFDCGRFGSQA